MVVDASSVNGSPRLRSEVDLEGSSKGVSSAEYFHVRRACLATQQAITLMTAFRVILLEVGTRACPRIHDTVLPRTGRIPGRALYATLAFDDLTR